MAKIRITAGARKHKITSGRILAALDNAELVAVDGDKEVYIGVDSYGVELKMVVIPDDRDPENKACIHATPTYYDD